jgi:urease accessory protein
MSVATLQSDSPAISVHGMGEVSYAVGPDGICRLKDLYQSDPVRVLFPTPPRGEIPGAVFVTTSGGLVGGDLIELTATAEENVHVQMTAQAAEKIYRSNGFDSRIEVTLQAQAGSWLEWLPQETIIFDGARLRRRTLAEVATGARMLAGEMLVLGRGAMGETVNYGLVCDDWEIRLDGRLTWADALRLDGDIAELVDHPAGLSGARAVATVVYVADDAGDYLETARRLLDTVPKDVRAGATMVNDLLLVRLMATDPYPLRNAFGDFWAEFRYAAAGLPAALPRLWQI